MNILIAHNKYKQVGGEDAVFKNESQLLQRCGEEIYLNIKTSMKIKGIVSKLFVALQTPYSIIEKFKLKAYLSKNSVDVLHVHNFFPLFSPSIFSAAKECGVPTVFTLHNYRTICPTATLMFDGTVNERSIAEGPFWLVKHRAYRDSLVGTAVLAFMIALNRRLGTWQNSVDCFIALTEFSRQKFIQAGFPADKIVVKPNFIKDPYEGGGLPAKKGGYAIYVGRLSEEKGISHLLKAWPEVGYPLKIVGDGPLMPDCQAAVNNNIQVLGFRDSAEVQRLIQGADFLIMPSTWYEGFPMTILEAFASGTPVLASSIGSLAEIIEDGITGRHFEAGSSSSIVSVVKSYLGLAPEDKASFEEQARKVYLENYTPEKNYEQLMAIYRSVC